jgi:hypothetical protein
MGEKVATNEIIEKVIRIMNDDNFALNRTIINAAENFLSTPSVIKQLSPNIVEDLCLSTDAYMWLKNTSEYMLIDVFVTTQNSNWLPAVSKLALSKMVAVTVAENKVVLYDKTEPVEISFPNPELRQRFIEAFLNQRARLRLCPKIPPETTREEP